MHRHAELKCFTNGSCFYTRANAAPKRRIKQHDIDGCVQDIRRELFKVYDDCVGCEWHANLLAHTAHSIHTKHRIFEIVVSNVFDLLSKPDRRFSGPDAIRIEAKAIALEGIPKRAI